MTQSGQGEQPSAREAREGIVLPSDGGEPLLPGQTGGYGGPQPGYGPPQQGHYGGPPEQGGYGGSAQPPRPAADAGYGQPPGGQAWGNAWGPGQQQGQPQPQAQQPQPQEWSQPTAQTWGTPQQPGGIPAQAQAHAQPQPAPAYDTNEPTSYYLPPVGQPAPQPQPQPQPQSQPLPPQQGQVAPYEAHGTGAPQQQATPGPNTDEPTSYYLPPVGRPLPSASGTPASAPLPPADEGATQFIPPVVAGPAAPEGATQFLPPVRPGALPPEVSAEAAHYPQSPYGAQTPQNAASGPDAEATQFIAPVPGQAPGAPYGGERQPPSDFDNLFRGGPGGDGGAASTQQMPRFTQPEAVPPAYGAQQPSYGAQQPSYGAPQPPYTPHGGDHYDDGDRGGRSRVPVLVAVGIGIVVLGIGAGALLAGGGGGDGGDKNQTVSATAPATGGSSSPAADPAKAQAVELDKLLADSGTSRSSVISAVANVKSCKNLGQAAADLRAAATQRTGLVTRLKELSVDRLPAHAELTEALTKAWQASASADNHYASWADQAAGKKGCKKGQARITGQTQAGNRDSGTASTEKARAARLWNAIAKKYSLTERTATQL
ncbi:hypothetical protein M2161_004517 [Streptomyces sp. SAI-133]|uniref:hypothetical protein n=1 Tax=unclassified Streptomyces TaxID=2593676 RepID=UPI0024733779|nr:hypothetical protein [Streptomyces sp. SAI-133]MDH6585411.1 hypothetical protein [Streptomyces sp. SAI-133]